jgi:YidC/Oxa1 family membrane protein insertase
METRRFILALSLSLLVFLTYMRFFAPKPPEQPVAPPKAAPQAAAPEKPAPAAQRPEALAQKIRTAAAGRDITVETDLVKVVVNTAGGVIRQYELKKYREADTTEVGIGVLVNKILGKEGPVKQPKRELGNVQLLPSPEALSAGDRVLPLTLTPLDRPLAKLAFVEYRPSHDKIVLGNDKPTQTLVLTYSGPGGIMIEKRLTFSNSDYKVDVAVNTKGFSGYTLSLGTDFGVADKLSKDASGRVGVAALLDGNTITEKFDKIKAETQHGGTIEWFGQEDKYFTAAVLFGGPGIMTIRKAPGPKEAGDLLTTEVTVKEKAEARTYGLYAGPKNFNLLKSYGRGLEHMVDYGWFGVLAKPMFWLMTLFYGITKNYGVAIILLTIVVRILLFYPSLKSATAMEEMKAVQPQLTALREKYKKDPQRMNQEMMKLYKEHKVNPLGGCLPMLLQIPFFVALYNVLSVSIELRQAPFISFWIKDLSVHDPFYILPVLMGASMILTMKMTAATPDPSQAKIMMFMNVAFIFLFAWLPAGLLLYITLSNVLSIVQQLYVRRIIAAAK